MKKFLLFFLIWCWQWNENRLYAQDSVTRMFRLYEDDDFINILGNGSDKAYTNGTRIDLFYYKKHRSHFFIDRAMPKAGDSSIDLYGWGLMQVMITPNDLSVTKYQSDDYPYSGALFFTHTLYSYNPEKKYDFQTELIAGVLGPLSLAKPTQTLVHNIENFQKPMGWDNQIGNDVLLNINFTAEKQLAASNDGFAELIGGGQVFFGTMLNGLSLYPLIRIGKMNPYFKGFLSQYSGNKNRWQTYAILRPHAELLFTNALLEGGLFSSKSFSRETDSHDRSVHDLQHLTGGLDFGFVVSSGHFGISFTQKATTALLKGLYSHQTGNISLYLSW
jgi:hypothetical protein